MRRSIELNWVMRCVWGVGGRSGVRIVRKLPGVGCKRAKRGHMQQRQNGFGQKLHEYDLRKGLSSMSYGRRSR